MATSLLVVVGLVAAVMLTTGSQTPAAAFAQAGHWVFNRSEGAVVHVDSGTRAVDARVAVPDAGDDAAFAVQGATQGFLVGRRNITVFGKSTLTVETTLPTGQDELPVGIETIGGPYLVYPQAGTIVRLGVPPTTVPLGGPVGRPVHTDDGTVWVHRTDTGEICSLSAGATELDCGVDTAAGTAGALAITQSVAGFVNTSNDAVQVVEGAGLLAAVGLGADLPDAALVADRDTEDRLPVVTANPNRLLLTDDGGVLAGRSGGAPVVVELGDGEFSGPVAAQGVVALIDLTGHRLLTFAVDGRALGSSDLPPGDGPPRIVRGGDGRLYVDDANGSQTHVVGTDGSITPVTTGTPSEAVVSAQPRAIAAALPAPPFGEPVFSGAASPIFREGGAQVPDQIGRLTEGQPFVPGSGDEPRPTPPDEDVVPAGPPGAPVGLRLTKDGGQGARTAWLDVAWMQPDLNGGTLQHYVVETTGSYGDPYKQTTTATAMNEIWLDRCAGPFTVAVRAVTSAGGRTLTGQAATVRTTYGGPCAVDYSISAQGTGQTTAAVTLTQNAPRDAAVVGDCSLRFDGSTVWNGQCGGSRFAANPTLQLPIGELQPGTTYDVVLRVEQLDGSTNTATTTVTTTAAAAAVRGDVTGDGAVDCADLDVVQNQQYGQSGDDLEGDLNNDSMVGAADLSILLTNWGTGGGDTASCQPPGN